MVGRERSGAVTCLEDGNPGTPVAGRLPRETGGRKLRERELSATEQGTLARTCSTAPAAECPPRARPRGLRAILAQTSIIKGKPLDASIAAQWWPDHPGRVPVAGRLPRVPSRDPDPTERPITTLLLMKYQSTHRTDHPGSGPVAGCLPREPTRNPTLVL